MIGRFIKFLYKLVAIVDFCLKSTANAVRRQKDSVEIKLHIQIYIRLVLQADS